jgi:hypothetical protein
MSFLIQGLENQSIPFTVLGVTNNLLYLPESFDPVGLTTFTGVKLSKNGAGWATASNQPVYEENYGQFSIPLTSSEVDTQGWLAYHIPAQPEEGTKVTRPHTGHIYVRSLMDEIDIKTATKAGIFVDTNLEPPAGAPNEVSLAHAILFNYYKETASFEQQVGGARIFKRRDGTTMFVQTVTDDNTKITRSQATLA